MASGASVFPSESVLSESGCSVRTRQSSRGYAYGRRYRTHVDLPQLTRYTAALAKYTGTVGLGTLRGWPRGPNKKTRKGTRYVPRIERNKIEPDIVILQISGRITLGYECQDVEVAVEDLVRNGSKKVVFDLSGLEYIDSTGLGIIVMCR